MIESLGGQRRRDKVDRGVQDHEHRIATKNCGGCHPIRSKALDVVLFREDKKKGLGDHIVGSSEKTQVG